MQLSRTSEGNVTRSIVCQNSEWRRRLGSAKQQSSRREKDEEEEASGRCISTKGALSPVRLC